VVVSLTRGLLLSLTALVISPSSPAVAQGSDWLARCRLQLADESQPESSRYLFQTRGKAAGAEARAQLDYGSGVSARAAVYPTEAKDLLNPYSNVSLSVSYFIPGDGKGKPMVGAVSYRAIGAGFAAIAGSPITMKLTVDGTSFGPFEPAPVSSGMYSVWLDTAETDGDGKPPRLGAADFGKLARAIDTMKAVEIALVRDGEEIVRGAIETPQSAPWRDGLSAWAARMNPGIGAATFCPGGDILN
jgi:hypothetical protein